MEKNNTLKLKKVNITTEIALLFAYILMVLFFALSSKYFFSFENFLKIGLYSSQLGILAAGMTIALIAGSLDISVGSIMALVGIITAIGFQFGLPAVPAVIVGIVLGGICGLINGLIITVGRVNPLITTLGTMTIFRGLAQIFSDGQMILIKNNNFNLIGRKYLFGTLPVPLLIMISVFILCWFILKYTYFGRQVYSVGGNARATFLSGVNVSNIRLWVSIICGIAAGISGIILAAQTGAGLPGSAATINMETIAAVILGGTSLAGGKGKIAGTVLGVLILATLGNGLNMLAIPAFYQEVIRGVVLITAVISDVLRGGGYKY